MKSTRPMEHEKLAGKRRIKAERGSWVTYNLTEVEQRSSRRLSTGDDTQVEGSVSDGPPMICRK
jgi:hypothetical protein